MAKLTGDSHQMAFFSPVGWPWNLLKCVKMLFAAKIRVAPDGHAKSEPLLEFQFNSVYFGHSVMQFSNLPFLFYLSLYFSYCFELKLWKNFSFS